MNYPDPETVPPIWQIGDVILDRYEVQQIFTDGGMGLVYRVHHRGWGMALAVKSPKPKFFQTAAQIESFEREAETWVNLGLHPHIVSCYYVRRLGGIPRIFAELENTLGKRREPRHPPRICFSHQNTPIPHSHHSCSTQSPFAATPSAAKKENYGASTGRNG